MTVEEQIASMLQQIMDNNNSLLTQALNLKPTDQSYYLDRITKIIDRTEQIIKPLR